MDFSILLSQEHSQDFLIPIDNIVFVKGGNYGTIVYYRGVDYYQCNKLDFLIVDQLPQEISVLIATQTALRKQYS